MADIKKFGLSGIGSNVQFGKSNGRIRWNTDHFELRNAADTAFVELLLSASPTQSNSAVTKSYVDSLVQGLSPKESVRAATTVAGTLATSFANGSVVDGVTLATGDRLLIKDQADATENGIYIVQASGAPVRSDDANTSAELAAAFCFVEEGTTNKNAGFVCEFTASETIGTDPIDWLKFAPAVAYTGSNGIALVGNDFQLDFTSLGTATIAGTDLVPFYDVSGSNEATTTAANFISALNIITTTEFPASAQAEVAALDALAAGMVAKTADATYANRTITAGGAGLEGINVANGTGIAGNPTIGLNVVGLTTIGEALDPTNDFLVVYNASTGNNVKVSVGAVSTAAAANGYGVIDLTGNFSGTGPSATSSNDTLTLNGGAGIALTGSTGTVSVALTAAGLTDTAIASGDVIPFFDSSASNAPVSRTIGNIIGDLNIVTATADGILVRTAANTYASRTITASAAAGQEGLVVTNGDGVAGNPTVGLDIDGLTDAGTVADSDEFVIFNGTNNVKITKAELEASLNIPTGTVLAMAAPVNFSGSSQSVAIGTLPLGARVLRTRIIVSTGWDVAVTVDVGISGGAANALMDNSENDPTLAASYEADSDYFSGASSKNVVAAVSAGGTAGAALVIVEYYTGASA